MFPGCGGTFGNDTGVITSPGYPGDYNNSEICTYLIEASMDDLLLTLRTQDFLLEKNFDYVWVSN